MNEVKSKDHIVPRVPGYERLFHHLAKAYEQASAGKGAERHADSRPFDQQPMQTLALENGAGFLTGQACKKITEALQMSEPDRALHELHGALVYIVGACIFLEDHHERWPGAQKETITNLREELKNLRGEPVPPAHPTSEWEI